MISSGSELPGAILLASDTGGGVVQFGAGQIDRVGPVILRKGVNLKGVGPSHSPFPTGERKGTVLSITTNGDCLPFENDIYGNYGVSDLSIYSATLSQSVVNISGVLYPRLTNVEIAGQAEIGLKLGKTGTNITLYGLFSHGRIDVTGKGAVIDGDQNANTFVAWHFMGGKLALEILGGAQGLSFLGCALEGTYSPAMEHEYLPPGTNLVKYPANTSGLYVVKLAKITSAKSTTFAGGYGELGGCPATYDDGTHGVLPLLPVIEVGPEAEDTQFNGFKWNCYLLDRGIRTQADGYKTKAPPVMQRKCATATLIPAYAYTDIELPIDCHTDEAIFNYSTGQVTIHHPGWYSLKALIHVEGMSAASPFCHLRLVVNGANYMGPNCPTSTAITGTLGLTAEAEMYLEAGSTVKVQAFLSESATLVADAGYNRLTIRQN